MAKEILLKRTGVGFEWRVWPCVALGHLQDFWRHIFRLIPMLFVPLLQDRHWCAGNLDIQFNVLGKARQREVRRPDECEGPYHFLPGMRDVGLCVKLVLSIHPAFDFPGAERVYDRVDTVKKMVLGFRGLDTLVQPLRNCPNGILECLLCPF